MNSNSPYIIAEVGNNHDGDFIKAHDLVHAAFAAGASCIKFQCIDYRNWVSRDLKIFARAKSTGFKTQLERLESVKLSVEQYIILAQLCQKVGIDFACTIFDDYIFQELKSYLAFVKISSAEIYNKNTLDLFAGFDKPIVFSTGLASGISEIARISRYIKTEPYILHCVSRYPTTLENSHLGNIRILQEEFGVDRIGYSDHTVGLAACTMAMTMGCKIIEKHFKLNSELGDEGDKPLSSSELEMRELVDYSRYINANILDYGLDFLSNRLDNPSWSQLARKAHVTCSVKAGQHITDDICSYYVSGDGDYTSFDVESFSLIATIDIEPGTSLSSSNCTVNSSNS